MSKVRTNSLRRDAFSVFARAMARYLDTQGWTVLVAGGVGIEARPPLKYNYRLVMDFTGKKRVTP
jgi:hypothetical protein